jgi:hypothetical protein
MNNNEYLNLLLESQELVEGCDELLELDQIATDLKRIVMGAYPNSLITFRDGGSRAKGTMIRADYDLDKVCYFQNDDLAPGLTLEDIYENMATLLKSTYAVARKRSALHLSKKNVDVVPGRYTDLTNTDVFLHQNEGSKERLKTNLETHINFVKFSGCTDIIKLAKFWRIRNGLEIKTFPLELLVIQILTADNSGNLDARFLRVLNEFANSIDSLSIQDPANPTGNDLSPCLTDKIRKRVSSVAQNTLDGVNEFGWEHVLGKIEKEFHVPNINIL